MAKLDVLYAVTDWARLNDQTTQTKYPASFVALDKRELRWNCNVHGPSTRWVRNSASRK